MSGPNNASVVMMDYDMPARVKPYRSRFASGKARLAIYPHAARPNVGWDGLLEKSPYICCIFVGAEGHIEILKRIGINHPMYASGWAYCQHKEFIPNPTPKKILFAPIHPTRRGFLAKVDADINLRAFQKLLSIRNQIEITVRHIQPLSVNGLPYIEGINYVDATTDLRKSTACVDENDVIVGHQTIAYIGIARGKPTIMMGEDVPPRNGSCEDDFQFVRNFDKYKDLLMFPYDILTEDDTMSLIQKAAISDMEIQDWRNRLIGNTFNPKTVSDAVISYL